MAHEIPRFSRDVLSKPQLITADGFASVVRYLDSRASVELAVETNRNKPERQEDGGVLLYGDTHVTKIDGTLTYRNLNTLCNVGTSYQGLKREAEEIANNPDIKTVLLDVSSGGGQAYGCFAAAQYFKETVKGAGKEIIAYIDELSASAAYAWTSIADEIIINPEAEAGSIGVVIRLIDESKALANEGIKPLYITAGADKVPFKEDGSFKQDFLDKLQASVDRLYVKFVDHISTNRGLSVDAVRATDANVFEAEEALRLGLVDKMMESEEFYSYLEKKSTNNRNKLANNGNSYLNNTPNEVKMSSSNKAEEVEMTAEVEDTIKEQLVENVEVTEQLTAVAETVEQSADLNASVANMAPETSELQAQLEAMQLELTAANARSEQVELQAAALRAEKEATQLASLTEQATAWASYGVDAEAFAALAVADMNSPLLSMMTSALNNANKTLEAADAMKELGASVEEEPEIEDEAKTIAKRRAAAVQSLTK